MWKKKKKDTFCVKNNTKKKPIVNNFVMKVFYFEKGMIYT